MTSSLKRTLNKIRIAILIVLTAMNFISALLITLTIDEVPLGAWPVWITFLLNIGFLLLMAYANGWMYGTELWTEREMMERGYTCTDCVKKNRCMDRSRNYCCTSFVPKEERREKTDGQRERSGRQGEAVPQR